MTNSFQEKLDKWWIKVEAEIFCSDDVADMNEREKRYIAEFLTKNRIKLEQKYGAMIVWNDPREWAKSILKKFKLEDAATVPSTPWNSMNEKMMIDLMANNKVLPKTNALQYYQEMKEHVFQILDSKNPDHIPCPELKIASPAFAEAIISGLVLRYISNTQKLDGGQLLTPMDVQQVINGVLLISKKEKIE